MVNTMRILAICPDLPWPLHGGPPLRIYHTLRVLNDKGHKITLLAGSQEDAKVPEELEAITEVVEIFPTSQSPRWVQLAKSLFSLQPYPAASFATPGYRKAVKDILDDQAGWDVVFANFLILVDGIAEADPVDAPVVLDQHESEVEIWDEYARKGNLAERLFARLNLLKVHRARKRAWEHLDGVICVAEEEIEELREFAPKDTQLLLAPNGVDTAFFDPKGAPPIPERDPSIILCAGMNVRRNEKAAKRFALDIFPRVREEMPGGTFWIVGANPPKSIRELAKLPGVKVTGTVPDVRPYYEKARVAVIPHKFGGYSKLKLAEAMAMGLPIVATRSGAKGAPDSDKLVKLAKNEEAFAREVIQLLQDDKLSAQLGEEGRSVAVKKMSWDVIIDQLEDEITSIRRERGGG